MTSHIPRTPSMRLDGKRALVTGASRGIGFASAIALAELGADLTIMARSREDLEKTGEIIRSVGATVEVLPLDISDTARVGEELANRLPYHVLVNAAGCNRPQLMLDVTMDDYDAVMDLNVKATYFVTQAVAASLVKAGKPGSLIHISSQMGQVGGTLRTVYCASKWALEGMSKALAIELASYGIRSNTIAPTFIKTKLTTASLSDPSYRDHVMSKIKLGRLGELEDIMGAVALLSSDAGAMMTGTTITVDGGWTAG